MPVTVRDCVICDILIFANLKIVFVVFGMRQHYYAIVRRSNRLSILLAYSKKRLFKTSKASGIANADKSELSGWADVRQ